MLDIILLVRYILIFSTEYSTAMKKSFIMFYYGLFRHSMGSGHINSFCTLFIVCAIAIFTLANVY